MSENQDSLLIQYDELATRHNAAFAAFRTIYESKLPVPVMPDVERESIFVPAALVIMIVASVLVSGSRTIVEFGGGLVGVSAFVMLEGAIIAYAFFHTRTAFQESSMENVRKLAKIGLILAFTVAVFANVHAVLKDKAVIVSTWVNTAILVSVGISAPTLAFISGEIMALETMRNTYRLRKAKEAHRKALAEWSEVLNASWAREKSKWGIKIEVSKSVPDSIPSIPLERNGMENQVSLPSRSILGHSKQPQASAIVRDYLDANPDAIQIDPRDLAVQLGVGKSTAYKIVMEYRQKGNQ